MKDIEYKRRISDRIEGHDSPDVTNEISLTYNWTSFSSRNGKNTLSCVRINDARILNDDIN